jgi:hypothetical protein
MLKNYFSRSLTVVSLLLLAHATHAQVPAWQRAIALTQDGGNSSQTTSTATNAAGEVFITGTFYNSIKLGTITLTSPARYSIDMFVAKWSPVTNSFVWAVQAGGPGADNARGLAVQGNSVYVSGSYNSAGATFGSIKMTSFGGSDAFVAKLTDAGSSATWTWVQHGGGASEDYGRSLAVSGTNVYVGGGYTAATGSSQATFGSSRLLNLGGYDGFVAKLADVGANPDFAWALPIQGNGNDDVSRLVASGDNVYAVGSFYSIPLQLGSLRVANRGNLDGFVTKLVDEGSSGRFAWGLGMGGERNDYLSAIAVSGNSLYLAGGFASPTLSIANTTFTNTGPGGTEDMLLAKITDAGTTANYQWASQLGGIDDDAATALVTRDGSCYVGGYFASPTLAIGGTTLTNLGRHDIYVTRFIDTGTAPAYVWALSAGGTTTDEVYDLSLSPKAELYVGGVIHGPVTFGTISATGSIGTIRDDNAFLATIGNAVAAPVLQLTLHPNPAHGVVTVRLPAAGATGFTVTDVVGRVVKKQPVTSLSSTEVPLDLNGLVPGAYLLRTSTGAVGRLVVE